MKNTSVLRIAIVGAGPAGIYAIEQLLEQTEMVIEIDIFDRLPTPFGLVRAGVAPDHPEKKGIMKNLFDFYLQHPQVRFFGNIEIGKHISAKDISKWYNAVIYASGAGSDRKLGIPGEELNGSWSAREFVAWYNGHPDFSDLKFDFSSKKAVIIGNGNVALDVARILTLPIEILKRTSIADYAITALSKSNIEEVIILGRRSHYQGAFNNPELEELGHYCDINISMEGNNILDREQVQLFKTLDWQNLRKVETLNKLANRKEISGAKRIVFRFLSSPTELIGHDAVNKVKVVSNKLEGTSLNMLKPISTASVDMITTSLVFRAIGYRGVQLPGVPFDEKTGTVPNKNGRIINQDKIVVGNYVTGWIKRGPKGIIGSNKKCARDTVQNLLEDYNNDLLRTSCLTAKEVEQKIKAANGKVINHENWKKIDYQEQRQGRKENRPRVKQTSWDMLTNTALN